MKQLPNLLIVDDTKENLVLLEAITRKIKVNLIQALSGSEALEKTHGINIALAIIDVQMPAMNGYELATKMNEARLEDKVPVIFLTANDIDEIEVFKGYDNGAVDYIYKPIHNHILLSKINIFLDLFNQKQKIIRNAALLKESANELFLLNAALKKSELKYRSYIDNAPDGVFVADETGKYVEINEAASNITGFSKEELLTMSVQDLLPIESMATSLAQFKEVVKNGTSKADFIFMHKNGSKRWWTVESVKVSLGNTRIISFAKDITDNKKAEKELKISLSQLHELTQYIEKVREDERVAISRELHDDLGQALTAVMIDLSIIKQNISDKEVVLKITKVSALVSETIKTVQRLTSQLRPQIIDDLGIEAAIEWYTKEFAKRNSVEVKLHIDAEISISPNASLNIFRIMQESLTNIARHSKASKVEIKLCKSEESILFRISDNGIGIKESEKISKKSFGIISMKERAASLGGSFEIFHQNGCGTVINLNLPLSNNEKL